MISRRPSRVEYEPEAEHPPLILEFFKRRPKLADASNRGEHTCRACRDENTMPSSKLKDGNRYSKLSYTSSGS